MKGKNDTIAERGSEDPIDILADDIVGIVEQHCKRLDRTGCSEQIAKTLRQGAHELWETSADDVTIQQLKAQLAALQLAYERLGEFY